MWITQDEQNKSVLALYMQLIYLKFPSAIQAFLNIVFAIETLHKTYFDFAVLTGEEIEKFNNEKKKSLQCCFSPEYRERINELLGSIASPSLSHRLRNLIEKNKHLLDEYIYDINDFIKKVKKQRNYLAHNHSDDKKSVISQDEYPYYIGVLKMIFECSFLKVIGFKEDQIQKMLRRNIYYTFLKIKVEEIRFVKKN